MARNLVEQFVVFYFSINDRPLVNNEEDEVGYGIWKHAVHLLEEHQRVHPLRTFKEKDDPHELTYTQWEYCDQCAEVEDRHGLAAWPVSFYHSKAFDRETLMALRDLCVECFDEAARASSLDSGTARFIEATTQTVYRENVTELVEGL